MRLKILGRFVPAIILLTGLLPATSNLVSADGCGFKLGFATIASMIPQQVGSCLDDEGHNPQNGDALQHSTGGLLVWRKADNWTAFTDGYHSWINGPNGLQERLNTQRFSWEANPDGLPLADSSGAPAAAPPAPSSGQAGPLKSGLPPFDPSPDGRFGGIQVSDVGVPVAQDLGLNWTREQYLWNNMPSFNPGLFNSISTDQHLAPGLREVGLLNFFAPYCNGGQDKRVPCGDMSAFGQFAGALAKAKQGRVDTWIMYNEPDICNPANPGFAWNSANRAQDYLRYAQAGYSAIKAANPGADVILGSLGITDSSCQDNGDEMTFWHQMLAALGNNPLPADEISLNIHKEPEKIYDLIKRYHESMQQHGYDKSLWIMEMGIPVVPSLNNGTTDGGLEVDKDNQESFLIQAYANAIAGGADHIGIYTMRDFPPSDSAYATIKEAVKFMSHVTSATKSPDNRSTGGTYVDRLEGVVTITMNGPGFQTVVAYNRSLTPQTVSIPATSSVAILADKHGNERQVSAQNGVYTLTLDPVTVVYNAPWGETVRFIGGSPLMLRQAA